MGVGISRFECDHISFDIESLKVLRISCHMLKAFDEILIPEVLASHDSKPYSYLGGKLASLTPTLKYEGNGL